MKRYIKAKYEKLNTYEFVMSLKRKLDNILDTDNGQFVTINPESRGTELCIENPPSDNDLKRYLAKALRSLKYGVYDIADYEDYGAGCDYALAAVKGNAWLALYIESGEHFGNDYMTYISVNNNTGNVVLEDWFNAYNRVLGNNNLQ